MGRRPVIPIVSPRREAPELGKVLLVGVGGFLGSVLRYLIGGLVQSAVGGTTFPYGTFFVNVSGCFLIGLLSQLIEVQGALGPGARSFLIVGVLGGYTTFSAFGNETVNLIRDGQRVAAGMNMGGQLVLALAAVWLGRLTAHLIWR
jgi:fluoride exporter